MNRLILRFFNTPALILFAAAAVAIQTSLFATWPLRFFEPDLILLVVIWVSLRRDFTEGGIITLVLAEIAELHSGAPQGVLLISYMTVYLAYRGAAKIFVLPVEDGMVRVSAAGSILWKISVGIVITLLAPNHHPWRHLLAYILPGAAIQAVLGLWVFKWLERFDVATFKNVTENPDDFQIDSLSI